VKCFVDNMYAISQRNSKSTQHRWDFVVKLRFRPLGLVVKRITSITSVCNDKIASSILAEGIFFAARTRSFAALQSRA
jgi:hypothetical protein